MQTAEKIVQKFFPNVKHVRDADKALTIEVTKRDNDSAAVRNHKSCAMAVACRRALHANGVIVSIGTAYIVRGNIATRYEVPEHVAREIVSFDREAGFAPGEYKLDPPSKTNKLGRIRGSGNHSAKRNTSSIKRAHLTSGIRTVLGSKNAV